MTSFIHFFFLSISLALEEHHVSLSASIFLVEAILDLCASSLNFMIVGLHFGTMSRVYN